LTDTHLSSRECALEHLHLAYDELAERGFKEVYHAGDLVAGRGIYPTQDQDLIHHTFDSQVEFASENYPRRDGLKTVLIAGNHDVEGAFGRMGADPVAAVSNQRDDFVYLGAYEGDVELPNGAFFKMVHGRGGGGYAVSYKPQKWVEGLAPGRKPALVVFGHWHIAGAFQHRNVHLLLAACFEWQTSLLVRLGLQPVVGFWTVRLRLADDGSVVMFAPTLHQFHEGRQVKAA
jgi:predicted phosphodiesterase